MTSMVTGAGYQIVGRSDLKRIYRS